MKIFRMVYDLEPFEEFVLALKFTSEVKDHCLKKLRSLIKNIAENI